MQVVNQPEPEEEKTQDKVKEFFRKIAGEDMEVDWIELKEILDYAMRNGNVLCSQQLNLILMCKNLGCNMSPVCTNTIPIFGDVQPHMYLKAVKTILKFSMI
jgi:hypothetical protein